jgi:hypothetical protein
VPENAHRLLDGGARHRLAELAHEARIPGARVADVAAVECDHASREHQSPRRGIHQHRFGIAEMLVPVAARNLVGDEPVGGLAIGDAQQRLGETHQNHALARRQAVFPQERVERAAAPPRRAYRLYERERAGTRVPGRGIRQACLVRERADQRLLIGEVRGIDRPSDGIGAFEGLEALHRQILLKSTPLSQYGGA